MRTVYLPLAPSSKLNRGTVIRHPSGPTNPKYLSADNRTRADKKIRVLLLDIETSPMEVFAWRLFKQTVLPHSIIKDWAMLSWAAKWLCESKVMSARATKRGAVERDDRKMCEKLWPLLEEADIVIAHNGIKFDIKKINTRFIVNGLKPPSPYMVIDTLKEARRHFAFSSNKLDYINETLGLQRKLETDFDLWRGCVNGDLRAIMAMEEYNRSDVTALEELYFMLRPWMKSHPNLGTFMDGTGTVCPACGGTNLTECGEYHTPCGKYTAFRCECGAIGRLRRTHITGLERASLGVSVAR